MQYIKKYIPQDNQSLDNRQIGVWENMTQQKKMMKHELIEIESGVEEEHKSIKE